MLINTMSVDNIEIGLSQLNISNIGNEHNLQSQIISNQDINPSIFKNKKSKILLWLFMPACTLDLNINQIVQLCDSYEIPKDIIIRKIISNYIYHIKGKERIVDKIIEDKTLTITNMDMINKLIDECEKYQYNIITNDKVNLLLNIDLKIISKNKEKNHRGYPLPDPLKGRPQLQWKECYYKNCHNTFDSANLLVNHLQNNGVYIRGFHLFHEQAINELNLTPEKIIQSKLTKCPSLVCDQIYNNFTPEQLCHHLKILGISPFWKPGDIVDIVDDHSLDTININDITIKPIFSSAECLVCFDNKPMIIFIPCYHYIVCLNCIYAIDKLRCPMCRSKVEYILPF